MLPDFVTPDYPHRGCFCITETSDRKRFDLLKPIELLSLLLALVIVLVYRIVLDYQGGLLQRHELKILEAVTTKDD